MSSRDMPTMAFCTFVAFFVRFFPASSALPFLFLRRQFSVHLARYEIFAARNRACESSQQSHKH